MKHFLPSKAYPPTSQPTTFRPTCKCKVFDETPGEAKIALPPVQSRLGIDFFLNHTSIYPSPCTRLPIDCPTQIISVITFQKGRLALSRSPGLRPPSLPWILAAWVSFYRTFHRQRSGSNFRDRVSLDHGFPSIQLSIGRVPGSRVHRDEILTSLSTVTSRQGGRRPRQRGARAVVGAAGHCARP